MEKLVFIQQKDKNNFLQLPIGEAERIVKEGKWHYTNKAKFRKFEKERQKEEARVLAIQEYQKATAKKYAKRENNYKVLTEEARIGLNDAIREEANKQAGPSPFI